MYGNLLLIILILVICIAILPNLYRSKFKESFSSGNPELRYLQNMNHIPNYDGLLLKPIDSCWRHPPSNLPLLDPYSLYTPQGTPINLKPKNNAGVGNNPLGPPVDDNPNSPRSLFTFAFNQCRPECCPSTYSCDKGCICTNESQRRLINKRGLSSMNKDTERIF